MSKSLGTYCFGVVENDVHDLHVNAFTAQPRRARRPAPPPPRHYMEVDVTIYVPSVTKLLANQRRICDIFPEDNVANISISHILLACASAPGYANSSQLYTHPGLHANFFAHSILGFLHFRSSGAENNDFGPAYEISFYATRYLPLPCVVADLWKSQNNTALSTAYLLSGIIPFTLAITRSDDLHMDIGNAMLAINAVTLVYLSRNVGSWALFTAGAGLFSHFFVCATGRVKLLYPIGLALMEYGAYKLFSTSSQRSS